MFIMYRYVNAYSVHKFKVYNKTKITIYFVVADTPQKSENSRNNNSEEEILQGKTAVPKPCTSLKALGSKPMVAQYCGCIYRSLLFFF